MDMWLAGKLDRLEVKLDRIEEKLDSLLKIADKNTGNHCEDCAAPISSDECICRDCFIKYHT